MAFARLDHVMERFQSQDGVDDFLLRQLSFARTTQQVHLHEAMKAGDQTGDLLFGGRVETGG
jgi:hypothetical protein